MSFSPAETEVCRQLVQLALHEDLDDSKDHTSHALIPADRKAMVAIVARVPGVLAGLPSAEAVLQAVDTQLSLQVLSAEGSSIESGQQLAHVTGPLRALLTAERTTLNFLQRLSGIASVTRQYVNAVDGLPCTILDTRKTTPGWRLLEKYAVRCGGGTNHRLGLYDGILIKDNHLAGLAEDRNQAVQQAIQVARQQCEAGLTIEVEVEDLGQLDAALAAGADVVMLDNMSIDQMRESVQRRNQQSSRTRLEASGGITLQNVRAVAETGVDYISVGALTHSAPALDIALDYRI